MMKARYFFYILLFLIFVFVPFEQSWTSGSGSGSKPNVEWGAWTVGQSTGSGDAKKTTFITNSEETACVKMAVKYSANQPKSAVPINKVDWKITMNNGFKVEKLVKSTSGPASSELLQNTSFTIDAKMKGSKDAAKAKKCDGKNGRNNTAMKVTVTFTGHYGTDPNNQQQVTLTKTWTQDAIDLIRQEYVDMTPPDKRAELPVPSYTAFVKTLPSNGVDDWNTGHYSYMIDVGLKKKKSSWLAEVNKYRKGKKDSKGKTLSQITDRQFKVNSAYRNPYHQRFHVSAPYTASFHSRHCYGDAMDVKTFDIDGDGKVEQKKLRIPKGSTEAQTSKLRADALKNSDDGDLLEKIAKDAGEKWTGSWKHYSSHTHADWTERGYGKWPPKKGTVYSKPCKGPSGTPTTTTTPSTTIPPPPPPESALPELVMHVCGIHATTVSGDHSRITPPCGDSSHAGYACQISSDHKTKLSGWSGTFYKCQPYTTFPCGHTDPTANEAYHAPRSICTVTNANGQSCTVTNFYDCYQHTHVYPAPTISCGRSACSQTVSSANEHRATCANGHTYWSCNPSAVNHHITRTCRYSACGKSWQKCMTGGTTPICDLPWRKRNGLRCWQIY